MRNAIRISHDSKTSSTKQPVAFSEKLAELLYRAVSSLETVKDRLQEKESGIYPESNLIHKAEKFSNAISDSDFKKGAELLYHITKANNIAENLRAEISKPLNEVLKAVRTIPFSANEKLEGLKKHLKRELSGYIATKKISNEKDLDEINRFKNELEDFGLELYSMHAGFPVLANADSDTPPELLEAQMKELKRFGLLGGKTAVYHACFMRDVAPDDIDEHIEKTGWEIFAERNIRTLKKLTHEASKYGISIVLENVWHSTRSASVSGFLAIVKAVDEPNIGVCLDSGHAHLAGKNVAEEIMFAGKWLKDTHFHDNIGPEGDKFNDQHLPPGLGTINWQGVCRALYDINYSNPVCFEGVLGPGDSIEKGKFGGKLSYKDLIEISVRNWKAIEIFVQEQNKKTRAA